MSFWPGASSIWSKDWLVSSPEEAASRILEANAVAAKPEFYRSTVITAYGVDKIMNQWFQQLN